jgi:DNA-binding FadR family transcriptional regulator
MLDAIKRRDPAAAERVMLDHLNAVEGLVLAPGTVTRRRRP